jgi:hypothetical protein
MASTFFSEFFGNKKKGVKINVYKITISQDVRVFWKVPKTGVTRSPVSSKVMMKTVQHENKKIQ